jgi:hypothetical protein
MGDQLRSMWYRAAMKGALIGAALCLAAAGPARAQTMLDQEQRLIELHSLLVALTPVNAPGAYQEGELSAGVEIITIPTIDGTTGSKKQITASDRTPLFPRFRFALGLPAPTDFRASVGVGYIPPIQINNVSSHFGGLEGEFAYAPGPLAIGLRGQILFAHSQSPVTDPNTRDTLDTFELGVNLAAGYRFDFPLGSVTPYAGFGVTRVAGDFTVTSDGVLLTSRTVNPDITAGVRLFATQHVEAVFELESFPGRLVHPSFRIAWVPSLWSRPPPPQQ